MTPISKAQPSTLQSALGAIAQLIRNRNTAEARQRAHQACHSWPERPEPWLITAQIEKQAGDFSAMLDAVKKAQSIQVNLQTQHLYIEALSYCGQNQTAIDTLHTLKKQLTDEKDKWRQLADLYTHMLLHTDAASCITHAIKATGRTPENLVAMASSDLVLGNLERAEQTFDEVLKASPSAFEVYYTRSSLRRQTPDNNHIDELQKAIAGAPSHPPAHVPLRYALAKEFEDLGEWGKSFEQLKLGAQFKRQSMPYKVETDLQIIDQIITTFNSRYFDKCTKGYEGAEPFFVLGLPRSGTTLVDRILNCSNDVQSLGEVNDFSLAVMRLCGPTTNAFERVKKSEHINLKDLGAQYCDAIAGYGPQANHLLDKTPFNSLNIGLIAAALPNARIIHVRRNPMANAYGVYKTLFRLGYPWSYSLDDIGRYMVAHDRLMTHWKEMLGERLIEVDYENLIADQETASRLLYEQCGLEWTKECLSFHQSSGPVATASATQVRQPLYKWAAQRWQHFEPHLEPVAKHFKAHNIS